MSQPLAIDLFTGLHGWAEGLVAEGYDVVGVDIEDMCAKFGQMRPPQVRLIVQDVLTLHGSQFRNASLIVASPPCPEFSYMAMPWKRAKQIARAIRGQDEFPADYRGSRTPAELTALFDACFRLQREACQTSDRYIPLVVENVRGAENWVGRARWKHGAFYLWGDVPALMPTTGDDGLKLGGSWFHGYRKGQGPRNHGSKSKARKMASALIAKIPFELSRHIAAAWHPSTMPTIGAAVKKG